MTAHVTPEGALNEVHNLLQQMRTLAVHAANSGVNSAADIAADQAQLDKAVASIDRISTTTKFNGSADMLLFMYGLFGFVILFGLVGMAGGIWQIKYGRRNKKLAYVILGMGLLFVIIGYLFRAFRA